MFSFMTLLDGLTGAPYNAPRFDSFRQGRSIRRVVAELALSTLAVLAVTGAIIALRHHLGLN